MTEELREEEPKTPNIDRFINRLVAAGDDDWQDTIVGIARIFEIAGTPTPPNAQDSRRLQRAAYNFVVMALPETPDPFQKHIRNTYVPDICAAVEIDDFHRLARELKKMILAMIGSFDIAAMRRVTEGGNRRKINKEQLRSEWNRARSLCESDAKCARELASDHGSQGWTSEAVIKNVRESRKMKLLPPAPKRRKKGKKKQLRK